jgi:hypothetical protein
MGEPPFRQRTEFTEKSNRFCIINEIADYSTKYISLEGVRYSKERIIDT